MSARTDETLRDLGLRRWDRVSPGDVEALTAEIAALKAEVTRLTNKTTDLRADLHRIRGERDHAVKAATKAVAEEVARLTRELTETKALSLQMAEAAARDFREQRDEALAHLAAARASRDEGERGFAVVDAAANMLPAYVFPEDNADAAQRSAAYYNGPDSLGPRGPWRVVPVIVRRVEAE